MYDGGIVWSFDADRDYTGSVAVANDKVYFSASAEGSSCAVFALNATNGAEVWSATRYPSGSAGRVAVAYGKVFICLGYGARGVYALDETNGDEIWAFPTSQNPFWAIVADGKVFFGPAYPDHMLYAVNESNGQIIWSYKLAGAAEGLSAAIAGGRLYVADHWRQKLYVFGSLYVARVSAYCYFEETDVSVSIVMDGSPTGYSTTHTFTELTGTHNFTVPSTDTNGHFFKEWNTGETSTTISVSMGGICTAYYQAKHNLSITTTAGGTTDPSPGNHSYWDLTEVGVTAIPSLGYLLDHWELDYSNVGAPSPITVTMDMNHTLRATFSWVGICNLTITPTTGGTTNPTPGTHNYTNGTEASVTAIPDIGYGLHHWELDGSNAGLENPIMVTMNTNHTLHAVFNLTHTLTIYTGAGGTTDPSPGTHTYFEGTTVTVTASPIALNAYFDHWELDGSWNYSNPINVKIDLDHTLRAVFAYIPVPVGGVVVPVDKFGVLAPYISLALTIIAATVAATIYVKRVRRRD
jgi:hypothetical protein